MPDDVICRLLALKLCLTLSSFNEFKSNTYLECKSTVKYRQKNRWQNMITLSLIAGLNTYRKQSGTEKNG